ncbi:phage virion morphogenesis protein [Burkholderia pseudomallei]|uniref:phage virion morphogenesis protein n=1 Tax=Burkholderia pseudomallei TaxID=28450 RepID=UPI00193D6177|nr:phage virion morphogenesis protein [Burkholderia pseudomallei]QRM23526.1 phage virion morphogenesis protein [Burkholderia pseudomallei]
MKISVTFDADALIAQLEEMVERSENLEPALEKIGSVLLTAARATFETGAAPSGVPWSPLKFTTLAHKRLNGWPDTILVATGELRDSIAYTTGTDWVAVGTDVPYGAEHMTGRDSPTVMAARQFVGMPDGGEAMIVETLIEHILGV